ncbi:unnamed protein product [Calypogeia fissa]
MSNHHTSGPCHRCGRGGHLARECSLHVCFRCNGRGHMAWECVEGVTCSRCGDRGHLQRNCKNVSCHKCGRKGHISKFCNDPFIKAEEVERNERHQAFLKSRVTPGPGSGKGGVTSLARTVSGPTGSQMVAPGPWDGLGNVAQDRSSLEVQAFGVGISKLTTNRSQSAVLGNVKILTVKRKIYPEANMEGAKRRPNVNCSNLENDIGGNPVETSPCEHTSKVDEPPQWNGLLGYGSDDSRDGSHDSSDGQSMEHNCHLQENVQMKLKFSFDDINGSGSDLQCSVGKEPTVVDERNGSESGLQSSGIVERSGSATESGLQPSVDHEPTGINEREGCTNRLAMYAMQCRTGSTGAF